MTASRPRYNVSLSCPPSSPHHAQALSLIPLPPLTLTPCYNALLTRSFPPSHTTPTASYTKPQHDHNAAIPCTNILHATPMLPRHTNAVLTNLPHANVTEHNTKATVPHQ
ncbi:hypothetical protein PIB30_112040, partial [Stylosanthes scabra]|nr:hypothetical protein [Stylosanthes scabra]